MDNTKPTQTEKALKKAHQFFQESLENPKILPKPDEFGYIKINYNYLQGLIKQLYNRGWSDGACYMLASVDTDKKNKRCET